MPTLPDNSVDLVLTDPPFYRVKGDAWDRQWDKPEKFLAWLDDVLAEFHRVLKPNGSLYVFASPQMSARVELLVGERFEVLNNIRWVKEAGWHQKQKKDEMRKFQNPWEACIFAEHKSDIARDWLNAEREKMGASVADIARAYQKRKGTRTVTGMASHWFNLSQWLFPSKGDYEWLAELSGGLSFQDEYWSVNRPFHTSPDRPYTDVWTYKTVQAYKGKHPCEKPQDMLRHIIETSSKPGDVVLDAFMGTGSTGIACRDMGREFVGIDKDADYYRAAVDRIDGGLRLVG